MIRTRIAATTVLGVGLVLLGAGGAQAGDLAPEVGSTRHSYTITVPVEQLATVPVATWDGVHNLVPGSTLADPGTATALGVDVNYANGGMNPDIAFTPPTVGAFELPYDDGGAGVLHVNVVARAGAVAGRSVTAAPGAGSAPHANGIVVNRGDTITAPVGMWDDAVVVTALDTDPIVEAQLGVQTVRYGEPYDITFTPMLVGSFDLPYTSDGAPGILHVDVVDPAAHAPTPRSTATPTTTQEPAGATTATQAPTTAAPASATATEPGKQSQTGQIAVLAALGVLLAAGVGAGAFMAGRRKETRSPGTPTGRVP
jgi:hypothetical protein